MANYMVFDMKDKQTTEYDYEVGETITVNSNMEYRCMNVAHKDDDIYYFFNRGKVIYRFEEIEDDEIENFINNVSR